MLARILAAGIIGGTLLGLSSVGILPGAFGVLTVLSVGILGTVCYPRKRRQYRDRETDVDRAVRLARDFSKVSATESR